MTTALNIIEASFRLIGVGIDGENLETNDQNNGLEALQYLLASWTEEGIAVPHTVWENFTLTSGSYSYTIGGNGTPDKDTVRPEAILGAFIRDSSNYDYYVNVINERQYRRFRDKSGTSGRPDYLWYKNAVPNGTIYLYPNPDSSTDTLHIFSLKPFAEPSATGDNIVTSTGIPRSMLRALKWNLAIELAPEYGFPIGQSLMFKADEAKSKIIQQNLAKDHGPVELPFWRSGTRPQSILEG